MLKIFSVFWIISVVLLGCESSNKSINVEESIHSENELNTCLREVDGPDAEMNPIVELGQKSMFVGTKAASYTFTTAGYTLDVATEVIRVPLKMALAVTACSWVQANHGPQMGICAPISLDQQSGSSEKTLYLGYGVGQKIFQNTLEWRRDPHISRAVDYSRKIALCHESLGNKIGLEKSLNILKKITDSPLYDAMIYYERDRVNADITRIKTKLTMIHPGYFSDLDQKKVTFATQAIRGSRVKTWHDEKNGMIWRLYSNKISSAHSASEICSGIGILEKNNWRLPNEKELKRAIEHGLTSTLLESKATPEDHQVFVGDLTESDGVLDLANGEAVDQQKTKEIGLLCVL